MNPGPIMLLYVILCALASLVGCATSRAMDAPPPRGAERDVFRKRLDADREIVVVQGIAVGPEVLSGVTREAVVAEPDSRMGTYAVRVELRARGHEPFPLASRIFEESREKDAESFDVLDMLIEPGQITLATAEYGFLMMWRIPVVGLPAFADLPLADWSATAVARPRDRNSLQATLRRTGDGRLTVEVVDLMEEKPRTHTLFEQVERIDGGWEFRRAKQYAEGGRPLPEETDAWGFGPGEGQVAERPISAPQSAGGNHPRTPRLPARFPPGRPPSSNHENE